MRTDPVAWAIFAANRARGAVTFDVHLLEGATRRRHLHESGSLRVRFPSPEAEGLSAVLLDTAGGAPARALFVIRLATPARSPPPGTAACAAQPHPDSRP